MNFDLLIVPDAGSNDSQYAELINCPILVIDHHILESPVTASNLILINNQLSPKYKNKDLSGANQVTKGQLKTVEKNIDKGRVNGEPVNDF